MDITMTQFNEVFKKYMTDVKILEKTHPSEAVKLWLKICQFIVDFAKTPNCPRPLRPKLITQAEAILIKVKHYQSGRISTVFNPEEAPNAPISTSTRIPSSPQSQSVQAIDKTTSDEESMLSQLMALPEIPHTELESTSSPHSSDLPSSQAPSSSLSPSIPGIQASSPKPSDIPSGSTALSPTDMSRLANLERELRQMPSNFKEITPTPYVPQNIIPPSQPGAIPPMNPDMYKDDLTTLDITKESDVGKTMDIDPSKSLGPQMRKSPSVKVGGFIPDPFSPPVSSSPKSFLESLKNAPPAPPPVDPFGPRHLPETDLDTGNLKLCFACGSALKPNSRICPQCGTENL